MQQKLWQPSEGSESASVMAAVAAVAEDACDAAGYAFRPEVQQKLDSWRVSVIVFPAPIPAASSRV